MSKRRYQLAGAALGLLVACGQSEPQGIWELDHQEDSGALMSVWGSGPTDVYAVGGQAGEGLLLHDDGDGWRRVDIAADQLLRWIYGFSADNIYAVGEGGLILHYDGVDWRRVESGTDKTLYGIWGQSGDDVWIVGGNSNGAPGDAVVLRGTGLQFDSVAIPPELLPGALYKPYGSPLGIVAVGDSGTVLRQIDGGWRRDPTPTSQPIFSLWGRGDADVYAVGGNSSGELLHFDGQAWQLVDGEVFGSGLSGVFTAPGQPLIAVGEAAYVLEIDVDGIVDEPVLPAVDPVPALHGVWGDGEGTTYAVGGDLHAYPAPMTGVILKRQ